MLKFLVAGLLLIAAALGTAVEARAQEMDMCELTYKQRNAFTRTPRLQAYQPAAKKGSVRAQYCMGVLHQLGWDREVPMNEKTAAQWYKKSAKQGYLPAQLELGMLHVGYNDAESMKWLRRAAAQGSGEAMSQMSLTIRRLKTDSSSEKDSIESLKWFLLAVKANPNVLHLESTRKEIEGMLKKGMTRAQISEAQKLAKKCSKRNYKKC